LSQIAPSLIRKPQRASCSSWCCAVGRHTNVGKVNQDFLNLGGSVAEYIAGRDLAIARRWFELDRSKTRIVLLQAGAEL
jgi:hypothetical protein